MEEVIIKRSADYYDDELCHHGTKGQKWGRRLYQNKDGSLTALGRSRYRKMARKQADADAKAAIKSGKASLDKSTESESKPKTKSIDEMSEAELSSAIRKLQLQKQYNQLYSELNPQKVSKGKEFADQFVNKAIVPAVTEAGKQVIKDALVNTASKKFGVNKKEVEDEFKETLKDMRDEADALDTMKRLINNRKWYEDYTSEQSKKSQSTSGGKTDRSSSESDSIADRLKNVGKKAEAKGKDFKDKGETLKNSGKKDDKNTPSKSGDSSTPAKTNTDTPSSSSNSSKRKKKKKKDGTSDDVEHAAADALFDKDGKLITNIKHTSIDDEKVTALVHTGMEVLHSDLTMDELRHFGIKGQKWGIRRFQNKDGSLTPQGKARYIDKEIARSNKAADEWDKIESIAHAPMYSYVNRYVAEKLATVKLDDVKTRDDIQKIVDKYSKEGFESYDGVYLKKGQMSPKERDEKIQQINERYNAKLDEAYRKGIPDIDIELIELERMEELDALDE